MCPEGIVYDAQAQPAEAGTQGYAMLVELIKRLAKGDSETLLLNEVTILVDSVCPTQMSAVSEDTSWHNLVAMLVLTFPEVRWVFGTVVGDLILSETPRNEARAEGLQSDLQTPSKVHEFPLQDHNLVSLLTALRRDPLFDPTGLREWVRHCTNSKLQQLNDPQGNIEPFAIVRRLHQAAAIDEEIDYAYMHAHAAYRYGFRADVVSSWALMKDRFGEKGQEIKESHGYELLLEDMRLVFPDRPLKTHLSDLKNGRGVECPLLANERDDSSWRFLITTGQDSLTSTLISDNERYLALKSPPRRWDLLYKPIGGITDLWQKCGLYKELGDSHSTGGNCLRQGNASGFEWPPEGLRNGLGGKVTSSTKSEFRKSDKSGGYSYNEGHGAPGKLVMVAASLIRRAAELQKAAISPAEFLRVAVLATDAVEYLGGKTPTLSLTAIVIKNDCEVRAECAFVGTGNSFSLKRRFREISEEVEAVTSWYHDAARASAEAKSTILNRLALVYREAGQVEEEHDCIVEFRRSNRKLNRPRGLSIYNPLAWFVHGILSYGEYVMASLERVIVITLGWICLISAVSWVLDSGTLALSNISFRKEFDMDTFVKVVTRTIGWMFGGNAEYSSYSWFSILSWFGVLVGVLHIGILISYLYSLISRK
jgi:hypothetical protein